MSELCGPGEVLIPGNVCGPGGGCPSGATKGGSCQFGTETMCLCCTASEAMPTEAECPEDYSSYSLDLTVDMVVGICCDSVVGGWADLGFGWTLAAPDDAGEIQTNCNETREPAAIPNRTFILMREATNGGTSNYGLSWSTSNILEGAWGIVMGWFNAWQGDEPSSYYGDGWAAPTRTMCLQSNPCLGATRMRRSTESLVAQLHRYNQQALATLGSDGVANAWSQQLSFAGSHNMESDVDESSSILLFIQDYPTYSAMETDLANLASETYRRRRTRGLSVTGVSPAHHPVPHRAFVHTIPGDLLYNASLFVMRGAAPDGVKALGVARAVARRLLHASSRTL